MEVLKDSEQMKRLITQYSQNEAVRIWGSFLTFVFVCWWMFSSGDFSFMLTLSSIVCMFSFLMVCIKVEANQSVSGVSLKMMECYCVVLTARLFAIIPFEGYLPFDKSGDWFYQLCEAVALCLAGNTVYNCRFRFAHTYNPAIDEMNHLFIVGPTAAVALIFHPNLNNFLPSDMSWAFALYLESVTVLPQLFMFMKEGQVQPFTAHFLMAQATSKFISFIFWASSFSELSNPNHSIKSWVGNWVVVMQLIQLVVMGDFIYNYVKCVRKGIPVSQLLTADNV